MPTSFRSASQLVALAVVLCSLPCNVKAERINGDELLDPDRIIEIRIELSSRDWSQLRRQARNPSTAFSAIPTESPYTYFKADLWIDGEEISSVGVRKKGFFGSADSQRPSLKIKFDEFVDQDPVKGLSRLTLNNNKQDRSQASQFLTYKLFRDAGNPAPRSNWAHVIVNGTSLGVYSNVESIKKSFLKRNFDDKSGNLYEGSLTDFHPQAIQSIEVKTNENDNDRADIKRLAKVLTARGDLDLEELEEIIDLDAFLRHWALESLAGFWDGYASNQNNYYLYFDPQDKRGYFIPWGADWAFTNSGPFSFGNRSTTVIYAQGMLANRLYHSEGIPQRYRTTMRELLDEVWDETAMLGELDRIEQLVIPYLHQAQAQTPQAMDEVRSFVRNRRAAVERALDDWRPRVPPQPRKPAYLVEVGTLTGSFSTTFGRSTSTKQEVNIAVELGGERLALEQQNLRIQSFRAPSFGGGFGGAFRPPVGGQNQPSLVSLVFSAAREGGQPITVSLNIDRETFASAEGQTIKVTGSFREGRGGGPGFGGGTRQTTMGEVHLTKTGTDAGAIVAGTLDLQIVESRGGMFGGNRGGFGGGRNQTPFGGNRGGFGGGRNGPPFGGNRGGFGGRRIQSPQRPSTD